MGCGDIIRLMLVPVRIANAMNDKKTFAPGPAKIRITCMHGFWRFAYH
ncbi:glycoside hydrolase family 19 protein, partial [Salmonella enterica]|nr:glycoside hydrolase family 19 protein [Salmonella enterica]